MPILIVSPNGHIVQKTTLAAASTANNIAGKVIRVTTDQTVDDVTIPVDTELIVENGAVITVNSGKTLTINSPYDIRSGGIVGPGTTVYAYVPATTRSVNVTGNAATATSAAIASTLIGFTGVVTDYIGATAPAGWVLLSGRTIGNAASGATERADADTSALYTLLWDSMADAQAAVSSGRGANAAADFAANKTITLPDARGRVVAGKDDMGGTTASRLTNAGAGIVGTTLGVSGGTQTHTLTVAQLATHSHTVEAGPNYNQADNYITKDSASAGYTTTSSNAGSDQAHQNTQPTLVLNKIIKL